MKQPYPHAASSSSLTIALITFALTTPYFFLDFGTVVTNFIEEGRSTHLG
ncbi:MAG: hypothetical protein R3E31_06745 [Chloroflexota bacterium]